MDYRVFEEISDDQFLEIYLEAMGLKFDPYNLNERSLGLYDDLPYA